MCESRDLFILSCYSPVIVILKYTFEKKFMIKIHTKTGQINFFCCTFVDSLIPLISINQSVYQCNYLTFTLPDNFSNYLSFFPAHFHSSFFIFVWYWCVTHLVQEDLIAEAQFPARGTGQESNRKLPCEQAGGHVQCRHPFSCGGSQGAEVDSEKGQSDQLLKGPKHEIFGFGFFT